MKKVLVLFLAISAWLVVDAQKFGYLDLQSVINAMPEMEQAKAQLEKEYRDIQNQLEEMQVEYNKKLQEYQNNMQLPDNDPNKWSKAVLQLKEQELTDLQQRIYNFQTTAQQTLQQRQTELLQPIYDKVNAKVDSIAKAKKIIAVWTQENVYYVNKDMVIDLTPEVKKALGLQ